jgi:demethylmenaquinone methyltransferase/2-methoxy-6-polyprenyl-1,4-benzoquinol methylase
VEIHGLDLSGIQLDYAAAKVSKSGTFLNLYKGSMDLLPFDDASFDLVVTSVAFCETTSEVRKGAIREVSRVLKGEFVFCNC